MQLREDLELKSVLRALTEVILPAVDGDNALAIEQTQLVIGMLQLMAARLPLQFRYDCDELARLVTLCETLAAHDADGTLSTACRDGAAVLARAKASPDEVLASVRALRAASGALIGSAYRDGDEATRAALSREVLAHAEQQLLRERAWFAPQGWESQPETLPAIETLI